MDNIITTDAPATPIAPSKTKIPRAPKPKRTTPRSLEELDTLDAKKMSPTESVLYIEACREALTGQAAKIEELTKNCTSAYEQFKNADNAYRKLKDDADSKLAFCARAAQTCFESIKMQGGTR